MVAHASLLIVNMIYAANYIIAKEVLLGGYIKPFGFIVIRVGVALVLYWILHALFIREKVDRKDIGLLALCGLFGVAINQLMFFKGLSFTSPIDASIVMVTTPVLVLVAAAILIKERITVLKSVGIALGAVGAFLLIILGKDSQIASDPTLGNFLIFINALSYGIYLVLAKPLMKKYHPLTVIKWVFLFGAFVVFPTGYSEFIEIDWASFTSDVWLGVAYVVIGTTFLAYLLNNFSLSRLNASVVGTYIYMQPVMATLIAVHFLEEQLDWVKITAGIVIFIGVYLVSKKHVQKNN